MTPKSLSWIVITNLKIFTVYVEMDCFSNQHYFAFVKSESHPFITSQSASQNVPNVLHSDPFLNILHKFSFIIKLCHLTLRFPFQTRAAVPWQKPLWIPIFSHFKNSLKRVLLIQFVTSVLFYQMRVMCIFLCPDILVTVWSWLIPWHLTYLLFSSYSTKTTTAGFWDLQ